MKNIKYTDIDVVICKQDFSIEYLNCSDRVIFFSLILLV